MGMKRILFLSHQRKRGPAHMLISDFQLPEQGDKTFLLSHPFVALSYSGPGKPRVPPLVKSALIFPQDHRLEARLARRSYVM